MPSALAFSSLLELHRRLEEVFRLHQELLIVRERELSIRVFDEYVRLLELHMRHEEEWLLPLYRKHGVLPRFPEVLYVGQHRKMRTQLRALQEQIDAIEHGSHELRAIIDVLDCEARYKHLAEHHDGAEAQGLFKALDAASPRAEQEVARRCNDEFLAALASEAALLDAARALLSDALANR